MKIKDSRCLFKLGTHNRTYISGHELDINHNGKDRKYWMVARGEEIVKPHEKKPDAVVIVAIHQNGDEKTLVVTNEFRPAIGMNEIGMA